MKPFVMIPSNPHNRDRAITRRMLAESLMDAAGIYCDVLRIDKPDIEDRKLIAKLTDTLFAWRISNDNSRQNS